MHSVCGLAHRQQSELHVNFPQSTGSGDTPKEGVKMVLTTHRGRVTSPVTFRKPNGKEGTIPPGPCFVEDDDEGSVAIFWGQSGELAAVLTPNEASEATNAGNLVLLD